MLRYAGFMANDDKWIGEKNYNMTHKQMRTPEAVIGFSTSFLKQPPPNFISWYREEDSLDFAVVFSRRGHCDRVDESGYNLWINIRFIQTLDRDLLGVEGDIHQWRLPVLHPSRNMPCGPLPSMSHPTSRKGLIVAAFGRVRTPPCSECTVPKGSKVQPWFTQCYTLPGMSACANCLLMHRISYCSFSEAT